MAIAGRVAIVPKGEWSQDVTYDKLDLVTHNGNTFIAYKSSAGVTPVDGDTWMLVMQGIDPQDIENIIDGTTPVGNSNKLGGKSASEYALIEFLKESGLYDEFLGTNSIDSDCTIQDLLNKRTALLFTNYTDGSNFPVAGGSGIIIPVASSIYSIVLYITTALNGIHLALATLNNGAWGLTWVRSVTTADLANYLPLTGGGEVTSDGRDIITLARTDKNIAGIGFKGNGNLLGALGLYGVDNPSFWDANGAVYSLLHTGNKPNGTYTGNGSATSRTIDVGGIGGAVIIYSEQSSGNTLAIVSKTCAIVSEPNGIRGTSESILTSSNQLLVASSSPSLNANGVTYTYWML